MRRVLPLVCVLLAACSDLVSPLRTNPYEYRKFVAIGTPTGAIDTVSFHWPRAMLPVRVWVAPDDALRPHIATAIDRWQGAFLYGEFRATMVDDSSTADIIVRNTVAPAGGAGALLELEAFAPECRGETDLFYSIPARTVILPIRMYVYPRFTTSPPGLESCYRLTATHEMGHAIGLLEHSPSVADLMFSDPLLDGISNRDRITAETVYHLRPTYTPSNRR
jgi:predicted Zn-dependent protease